MIQTALSQVEDTPQQSRPNTKTMKTELKPKSWEARVFDSTSGLQRQHLAQRLDEGYVMVSQNASGDIKVRSGTSYRRLTKNGDDVAVQCTPRRHAVAATP